MRSAALASAIILTIGCESRDERLADFAGQALDQQSRQNEEMARQSQQVAQHSTELAKAAHSLVEQDAQARRELIQAQSELQSQLHVERAGLDIQRQDLQAERKAVAAAAVREPVIAQAILVVGLVLATLLPLLVTAYAIRCLPDPRPSDTFVAEELLEYLDCELRLTSPGSPPALPASADPPRLADQGTSDPSPQL
jgi:hypothetical protein